MLELGWPRAVEASRKTAVLAGDTVSGVNRVRVRCQGAKTLHHDPSEFHAPARSTGSDA